jgi:hypothetical protein
MTEQCPGCGNYREILLTCAKCGVHRCGACTQLEGLFSRNKASTSRPEIDWLCDDCAQIADPSKRDMIDQASI